MGRELNPSPPQRRANALTITPQTRILIRLFQVSHFGMFQKRNKREQDKKGESTRKTGEFKGNENIGEKGRLIIFTPTN